MALRNGRRVKATSLPVPSHSCPAKTLRAPWNRPADAEWRTQKMTTSPPQSIFTKSAATCIMHVICSLWQPNTTAHRAHSGWHSDYWAKTLDNATPDRFQTKEGIRESRNHRETCRHLAMPHHWSDARSAHRSGFRMARTGAPHVLLTLPLSYVRNTITSLGCLNSHHFSCLAHCVPP